MLLKLQRRREEIEQAKTHVVHEEPFFSIEAAALQLMREQQRAWADGDETDVQM